MGERVHAISIARCQGVRCYCGRDILTYCRCGVSLRRLEKSSRGDLSELFLIKNPCVSANFSFFSLTPSTTVGYFNNNSFLTHLLPTFVLSLSPTTPKSHHGQGTHRPLFRPSYNLCCAFPPPATHGVRVLTRARPPFIHLLSLRTVTSLASQHAHTSHPTCSYPCPSLPRLRLRFRPRRRSSRRCS